MTQHRPACPVCGHPIDALRATPDLTAAYPCGHWLTPNQAATAHADTRPTQEQP